MAEDVPTTAAAATGGGEDAVTKKETEAVEEKMDHLQALQVVLKQAIPASGVRRGLRECAQMLARGVARVCLLAKDCEEAEIVKLVKALADSSRPNPTPIIEIESRELLGQWVGLATFNEEGEVKKVVKCSVAVITDFGEESRALRILLDHIEKRKDA